MNEETVLIPFDPDTESMYCSWDGLKLEKSGHMWYEFMLCPRHGEFTLAPTIMREPEEELNFKGVFVTNSSPNAGKWFIRVDQQEASMISNIKYLDERHKDGSDYDPRESRVI